MRRNTLKIISAILAGIVAIATYYSIGFLAEYLNFRNSLTETMLFFTSGISGLLFKYIFEKILFKIQKDILNFRKANGNDIEEQEKFETDAGLISLSINNNK